MRRENPYIPRRIDTGDDPHETGTSLILPQPADPHPPRRIVFRVRRWVPVALRIALVAVGAFVGFLLLVPFLGLLTAWLQSAAAALADLLGAIVNLGAQFAPLLFTVFFIWGMILAWLKDRP